MYSNRLSTDFVATGIMVPVWYRVMLVLPVDASSIYLLVHLAVVAMTTQSVAIPPPPMLAVPVNVPLPV